jgi:hypothetical protein
MTKAVLLVAILLLLGAESACSSGGPSCTNTCSTSGATQCSGAQLQTCAAAANGCLAWSTAVSCSTGLSCDPAQGTCSEHLVTITWTANRESGVNQAGGGYQVFITGQPTINVPYVSGTSAPTSATAMLPGGSHTVTVRAYAALDAQGGTTGTLSAPSQSIQVTVP